jgi:hypothetical protein
LRTPSRPANIGNPLDPTSKAMANENYWIWLIYEDLRKHLEKAIEPLKEYLSKFDKYKSILGLNPVEYAEKIENEGKEINDIREEILEMQKKEKSIKEGLPEVIQVSFFEVNKIIF